MTGRLGVKMAAGALGVLGCAAAGTWVLLAHLRLAIGPGSALPKWAWAPGLSRLPPAVRLSLVAACFLLPAGGLILGVIRRYRATPWQPGNAGEVRRLWVAALATGLLASVLFPGLAWYRPGPRLSRDLATLIWGWTLWGNVLVCMVGGAVMMGLLSLGRLARRAWAELLFTALGLWVGLAWLLFEGVTRGWPALSGLGGLAACVPPAALAVSSLCSLAAALPAVGEECALDVLLRPLALLLRGRFLPGLAWILAVLGLGATAMVLVARAGGPVLLQEGLAFGVGLGLFAGLFAALPLRQPRILWVYALTLTPLLALGLFLDFEAGLELRAHPGLALELETGRDAEVRLLREALDPPRRSGSAWLDPEAEAEAGNAGGPR